MRCDKKSVFDFLNGAGQGSSNIQFSIPIYQRNYAWERTHCERLLQDIFELAEVGTTAKPHFCGSIVYTIKEQDHVVLGKVNNCDVVDGQQRLTTLSLIIKALHAIGTAFPAASAALKTNVLPQLEERLFLSFHNKAAGYKLVLHTDDNVEFEAIMKGTTINPVNSFRMRDNFIFIREVLEKYIAGNEDNITIIKNTLQKFEICWIELDSNDNPQDIFETLNSLGKELEIGDLVRNYILMQIPSASLNAYYPKWQSIERNCWSNGHWLNNFISTFLVYHNDTNKGIVDKTRVLYSWFRKYSEKIVTRATANGKTKIDALSEILDELSVLSEIYGYLIGSVPFPTSSYSAYIFQAFDDIRRLKITTIYPFIMHMMMV